MNSPALARALVAVGLCAAPTLRAQSLDTVPLTYGYPGVGAVTWTPVKGLKTMIAAPHFSSGPRVLCAGDAYRCDIAIELRNVRYFARSEKELMDEVREQFQQLNNAPPPNATLEQRALGALRSLTYSDTRRGAAFRYVAMALVIRGPVVFQITAQAQDTTTLNKVFSLALSARLVDELPMMTYRIGQMVDACAQRSPSSLPRNQRARAVSPFSDAVLVQYLRVSDSTATLATVSENRSKQLPQFLRALDELTVPSRDALCARMPTIIEQAAKELGRGS